MLDRGSMGRWCASGCAPKRRRASSGLLLLAASFHCEDVSLAYESEVFATVDAQFYALESPSGEPLISRRRYTDTLGLSLYDLYGERRYGAPTLTFRSRLRLDADFGIEPAERDPSSLRYVPGLEQAPLDLMYAYLEGERHLGGVLGFRLGRQHAVDVLGFWSFDGALLSFTTPAYLRLEAYGGIEQRAGLPLLTTPRYQADGVSRGSRESLRDDQWTSYLHQARVAPAFGVALETSDLGFLHARASYRRVQNRDTVVVSPFADDISELRTYSEDRVSTEKVGASLRLDEPGLGAASGSLVRDLYAGVTSDAAFSLDWYAHTRLTVGADYERVVPTFDGDSIFNWFSHSPTTSALGRAELRISRRLQSTLAAGVRWFETEGSPAEYEDLGPQETPDRTHTARLFDVSADAGVRYDLGRGSVALRGGGERGERGHRLGADLTGRRRFGAGRYDALCVLSLWDWSDALRKDRDATSFGYVLGAGLTPGANFFARSRLGVEFEHHMNRLVGQRFRALLTLDMTVLK
jgi:hypothetical protein